MCFRAFTIRTIPLPRLASTSSPAPLRAFTRLPQTPRLLTKTLPKYPSLGRRTYSNGYYSGKSFQIKNSGSALYTAAVVFGLAIGGALLYPLAIGATEDIIQKERPALNFDRSHFTDSYLVMAPNTPPGRPGTLTAEQEGKLRELWALTMKVFGVYEAPEAVDSNGRETPTPSSPVATKEEGKKDKEKKKSRLHVFRRNKDGKDGKDTDSESVSASGTSTPTPSDLSSLSLADEDDKHGQTKQFKAALANMAPEDLRNAFWSMVKHDHPDALLLRFLRARKWDVQQALIMMISTMHWRLEEMHVDDDIMPQGELFAFEQSKSDDAKVKKDGEDFLAALRMGKSFFHGLDKDGRPLCFVRVRLHRQGEQSEESIERFTVYTIETARMLLRPPIDTATIVFDMTSFSMANMDYAPVKFMIKCFEANYPESLGTVLVYKAPWIFNTIWTIIRGWLDPVVAGKVHFCKTVDDLEAFVPKSQIPTECDGDEKWEYVYKEPQPGENDAMKDTTTRDALQESRQALVSKYESTVLEWIHADASAAAGGGKSADERRKERDAVAEDLRANYWTLDPYVRARSLYDRVGVLKRDGGVEFYPAEKTDVPAAQDTSQDDLD